MIRYCYQQDLNSIIINTGEYPIFINEIYFEFLIIITEHFILHCGMDQFSQSISFIPTKKKRFTTSCKQLTILQEKNSVSLKILKQYQQLLLLNQPFSV